MLTILLNPYQEPHALTQIIEIQPAPKFKRIISFIIDYILLLPLFLVLYPLWKDMIWDGRSIGNRVVGLQVINATTGKVPSKKRIIFRNFFFIITLTLSSLYLFFNDGKRGLGDRIVDTMVIRNVNVQ